MRLGRHHAAADDDAARSRCTDDGVTKLRQRPGDAFPHRIFRCQAGNAVPESLAQHRARRQAFDAIAVERAGPLKIVAFKARNADMPELAVAKAPHRLPGHDQAHPDAGSDGDVGKIVHVPAGAPAHLGQRGSVDVSVERDRRRECILQFPEQVDFIPPRLLHRPDMPVGCRRWIEIERTEAGDAGRRDLVRLAPLQQRCAKTLGIALPKDGRAIYMLAEKIVTGSESLRADWRVEGTTGYDFANHVIQLLVDPAAETAITKTFHRFIGHSMPFGHLQYAKKLLVMKVALANDVDVLSNMLDRLSEQNRWYRDFTLEALSRTMRETIACFPVYRTYLDPDQPVSEEDRQIVERAIAAAKRRNPAMEESIFDFLRDVLLFRFPTNLDAAGRAAHTHFVLKFQQTTGPVMAKGLEDTVFYIYNRLAALNEVGGEPQQFGLSVNAFHERNLDRQRHWPAGLLATSTHDTKRSEDVRARIAAISEIPELWRRSLQRWHTANRRWKRTVNDLEAPDGNEEYLLYQTLLGTWPMQADGEPEPIPAPEYIERIQAYMAKALKEAKINTSWIQPNEEWDAAMRDFVAAILDASQRNKFLSTFCPVAKEIARLGAINSLTQTLFKLTSPGVPDIYQGNEVWDYSLVDPDNRRAVDYDLRGQMLKSLSVATPNELMPTWPDGRIKMFLTERVLRFRVKQSDLFRRGEYLPVSASGTFAECCVGFVRRLDDDWIAVVAPRVSSRIGFPPIGELWKDTAIELPKKLSLKNAHDLFTCQQVRHQEREVAARDVFSVLPFAVITNL